MLGDRIYLFSDGAARGNPGPSGWSAIIVDLTAELQVVERGGRLPHGTNNQAELDGAIAALEHVAARPGPVGLFSDSSYVLLGASRWSRDWARRGWRGRSGEVVANVERWQRLHALVVARKPLGPLTFHYLRGHTGIPANERADEIACAFADVRSINLYRGPLVGYEVAILDLPEDTSVPARGAGGGSRSRAGATAASGAPDAAADAPKPAFKSDGAKKAPLCYLSLVGGQLERHGSWADCEARVRGQRGARFRKAMTADEERAILRQWGVG